MYLYSLWKLASCVNPTVQSAAKVMTPASMYMSYGSEGQYFYGSLYIIPFHLKRFWARLFSVTDSALRTPLLDGELGPVRTGGVPSPGRGGRPARVHPQLGARRRQLGQRQSPSAAVHPGGRLPSRLPSTRSQTVTTTLLFRHVSHNHVSQNTLILWYVLAVREVKGRPSQSVSHNSSKYLEWNLV